jgi:hypothetical protein
VSERLFMHHMREEDKESTSISSSPDRLFQMIRKGDPKCDDRTAQLTLADRDDPFHHNFRLTPLKALPLDPERMSTLTRVRSAGLATSQGLRAAFLLDAVVLPLIRAAQVAVVALQHGVGRVVGRKCLAGDGVRLAVVPDDAVAGHHGCLIG